MHTGVIPYFCPFCATLRKLSAILLLACIFLEIGGYFFIYRINRKIIKREVREYLHDHADEFSQTEFRFNLSDQQDAYAELEWEDAREFRYHGEMYDVVERRETKQEVYIRCVKDDQESALVANFEKIISGKSSNRSTSTLGFINFLTTLFPPEERPELVPLNKIPSTFQANPDADICKMDFEVITPPPKLAPSLFESLTM